MSHLLRPEDTLAVQEQESHKSHTNSYTLKRKSKKERAFGAMANIS